MEKLKELSMMIKKSNEPFIYYFDISQQTFKTNDCITKENKNFTNDTLQSPPIKFLEAISYRYGLNVEHNLVLSNQLFNEYYDEALSSTNAFEIDFTALGLLHLCDIIGKFDLKKATRYFSFSLNINPSCIIYLIDIFLSDNNIVDKEMILDYLMISVNQSHTTSMIILGHLYVYGFLVEKDIAKGIDLLSKAISLGDGLAAYIIYNQNKALGLAFDNDFLLDIAIESKNVYALFLLASRHLMNFEFDKAIEYLIEAANNNFALAYDTLGTIYEMDIFEDSKIIDAYNCYLKGALLNNNNALYHLGLCYELGKSCSVDYNKAFECYKKASDNDHLEAIVSLGYCYEHSIGTTCDFDKAFKYYMIGYYKEHSISTYYLGRCYEYGYGTSKNIHEALKCYEKAAALRSDEAIYKLGELHFLGEVVDLDYNLAYDYFTKSSMLGNIDAFFMLGYMQKDDTYKKMNIDESFKNLELAANENHARACYELGNIYFSNQHVINYEKAFRYFEKSAFLGYSLATYALGLCYEFGYGVEKNINKANELYQIAKKQ